MVNISVSSLYEVVGSVKVATVLSRLNKWFCRCAGWLLFVSLGNAVWFANSNSHISVAFAADQHNERPSAPLLNSLSNPRSFGNYYALFIANEDYQFLPSLDSPIDDAQMIATILRAKYDFDVSVIENGDKSTILTGIENYIQRLTSDDSLLIYYSGHSDIGREDDIHFWLHSESDPDDSTTWVYLDVVAEILAEIPARNVLVIEDIFVGLAAISSPDYSPEQDRSREDRAKRIDSIFDRRSRLAITSGNLRPLIDPGSLEYPTFARNLSDILRENEDILEAEFLASQLTIRDKSAAEQLGLLQSPVFGPIQNSGHDGGSFFFIPAHLK